MSRAIMRQQVSINLAINVQVDDRLITLPLVSLVWLVMALWQSRRVAGRARYELTMFWQDITQAAAFTGKVFTIAFNSWAFGLGLGVRL